MKNDLKKKRKALIDGLIQNPLKRKKEVAFTVEREKLGELGKRIGVRCDRNMKERIETCIEVKEEGLEI